MNRNILFDATSHAARPLETPCRKRETVPRHQAEDAIESLEQEIEILEEELSDRQTALSDLRRSLREASPDTEEVAIGPACVICTEYEPMHLKTYCSECGRKIRQLSEMGKTPPQICGARSDLLVLVSHLVAPSTEALS